MDDLKRKHWRAIDELKEDSLRDQLASKEFAHEIPVEDFLLGVKEKLGEKTSRRDFLKWVGFSTASAVLAACKGPVIRSIPYVVKPQSITPGIPNYYASTFFDGFDLRGVFVKTREGRPIKIDANEHMDAFNTSSARMQASLLSLYSDERIGNPFIKGKEASWQELDKHVIKKLKEVSEKGKQIVILSASFPSPSTKELINDFSKAYHTTRLVTYDAISYDAALEATQEVFGIRALPQYKLDEIELLISFDGDFLGDLSPDALQGDYARMRTPGKSMLRHIQVESHMSLSGANADKRIPLKPSQINTLLVEVYKLLDGSSSENKLAKALVLEIKKKGPKALLLAGLNKEAYTLALLINQKIHSKGFSGKFIYTKESDNKAFDLFFEDLKKGHVGALLIHNTNPLYSFPYSDELKKAMESLELSLCFSMKKDETTQYVDALAPMHHWLESWGDTKPMDGLYTLIQPTIQPLFNTRQFQDSLLLWGNAQKKILEEQSQEKSFDLTSFLSALPYYDGKIRNYYDYLRRFWEKNILSKLPLGWSFNKALFEGAIKIEEKTSYLLKEPNKEKIKGYLEKLSQNPLNKGLELKLYIKTAIGDGSQADNPWLQELPDPITRTTWDNYLLISSFDANRLGLRNWHVGNGAMNGDLVDITFLDLEIKNVPVLIQPGQAIGSVALAFGYGQMIGKLSSLVKGINAYAFYKEFHFEQFGLEITKAKGSHLFASMQLQHTMAGRSSIAKETTLETFLKKPKEQWNEQEKFGTYKGKLPSEKISLWQERDRSSGHHFNLSIDLNTCIGCGACVMACQSENNIPVVGKEEIRNSRDMHWIRIDRYYSTKESFDSLEEKGLSTKNMFKEPSIYKHLLEPETDPEVIFQPIMCQHCNNAPCESVCPVAATTHSSQGQNMMAYNRCVGTRYCANNCPYKVRRFNWFNYSQNDEFDFHMNSDLGRMVLNPDVVVRSRGVMEKCSMCIQKTQATILKGKKEKRKIKDEEFQTACSSACPTSSIIFGDINDQESEVSKKLNEDRTYKLLDFIGTRPNVSYQVKIRNSE